MGYLINAILAMERSLKNHNGFGQRLTLLLYLDISLAREKSIKQLF